PHLHLPSFPTRRSSDLLDRNATVHDLDAFMQDLRRALADPGLIIVIPGRSTTNTLTSIGQGSQMVEEGHRSYLKGLIGLLGGAADRKSTRLNSSHDQIS